MGYDYKTERPWLFTEDGSACFIKARDNTRSLLAKAGAFMALKPFEDVVICDAWKMIAILDRMVEAGDIREVTVGLAVSAQERVFVAKGLR